MVTVWIFFGSAETCPGDSGIGAGVGIAAGGAAPPGDGGQGEFEADAAGPGAPGAVMPGGTEPCPLMIGMVETTRGAAFGGSIFTGCSSRETRFSVEPVVAAPA